MSAKSKLKENQKAEIKKRSEVELLEEEIRNQQTLDRLLNLIRTGADQKYLLGESYELKKITIFNLK